MGAAHAAKAVGPPTPPKGFFIEAASGLLNCDRSGNSSCSTLFVDSSRLVSANSGHLPTAWPARPESHALAVNVGHLQVRDFGHAQARAVGDAERRLVLEARRGFTTGVRR